MKKKELLVVLCILLPALLLWGGQTLLQRNDCGSIRITVDGKEYGVWSLAEDQVIHIHDTNVCEIRDGQVRMTEASCPDHLCIRQGAIDAGGGMIVCLPNRVVIEPAAADRSSSAPDAVA